MTMIQNHYYVPMKEEAPLHGTVQSIQDSLFYFLSRVKFPSRRRSILQRWKRALHVPLRLDVYYQHDDSRRELLERWCLEYAPKSATHHPTASFQNPSADPIVQLRAVCKQIVIWLRSLYCWSRMLPSQALKNQNMQNNAIGFSIYVVSEGNDDVSGLVSQQGFSSQFQPHSVWTPYGELGWRVFYAPQSVIQRFIPERNPYSSPAMVRMSQPIPMQPRHVVQNRSTQQQQQQQQQQPTNQLMEQYPDHEMQQAQSYHPNRDLNRRESVQGPMPIARSAPHQSNRLHHRSKSDVHGLHDAAVELETISGTPSEQNRTGNIISLHRQNSSPASPSGGGKSLPSKKNLSGLSLAMMTLSDDELGGNPTAVDPATTMTTAVPVEVAEKRRAALHHAPPHLPSSSTIAPTKKSPLASAGEYGYAYNNQIPTMRPSQPQGGGNVSYGQTPPTSNQPLSYSSIPSSTPLGTTPPGYLLGGLTSSPHLSTSHLIPPRNSAVTPPFTRPMGFVDEIPTQQSLPPAALPSGSSDGRPPPFTSLQSQQQQQEAMQQHSHHVGGSSAPVPTTTTTTSLDLLHSNPFRLQIYGSNFGSSATAAMDPFISGSVAGGHSSLDLAFAGSHFGSGVHPRLHHHTADDDDDNMPFAVDSLIVGNTDNPHHDPSSSSALTVNPNGSSSSAMIMRDMIVQPPKRLQLFDKGGRGGGGDNHHGGSGEGAGGIVEKMDEDIASQLAEFKTFGANLMI